MTLPFCFPLCREQQWLRRQPLLHRRQLLQWMALPPPLRARSCFYPLVCLSGGHLWLFLPNELVIMELCWHEFGNSGDKVCVSLNIERLKHVTSSIKAIRLPWNQTHTKFWLRLPHLLTRLSSLQHWRPLVSLHTMSCRSEVRIMILMTGTGFLPWSISRLKKARNDRSYWSWEPTTSIWATS
jgi:hypothetical protein